VLGAALARGVVEVWPSPTQVLETMLCADFDEDQNLVQTPKLDLRVAIASTLIHLAEGRRMAPAYPFVVVEHFMKALDSLAPGCVRTWKVFRLLEKENQRTYLGLLSLLAAYRNLQQPDAVTDVLRTKVTSRLLHSRFARSPRDYLDDVITAAKEFRVRADIREDYDRRSLSDLLREIEENEAAVVRLDGGLIQRLQRDREMIARSYGAVELGECMSSVFQEPLFLFLTFDLVQIKAQWRRIMERDVQPPAFLADSEDERCFHDDDLLVETLEMLFRILARERLLIPHVVHKVIVGELELAARQGEIPSRGLGFDSEHAAMLTRVNAFATVDGRFATLATRAAADFAEVGQHNVRVLVGADNLIEYLESL